MKRSIKHLPKQTQEEINFLLESIMHLLPKCEMIILYGSYAHGGYVLWDEKVEFGIHTSYQSDLDIMVVISESNSLIAEQRLRFKVTEKYHKAFAHRRHASPQFIVEDIYRLNKELERSQYFFTDIAKEGIKLYDSKRMKLAKPRKLSFKEIKQFAKDEYEINYPDGEGFLRYGKTSLNDETYRIGSFLLHQACERFYTAISLVFTNYRSKTHKLTELGARVKECSRELATIFPQNTDFEKRCFDLICRAYIEARYNKDFMVSREELTYMIQRVELLREMTQRICHEKFAVYDELIEWE